MEDKTQTKAFFIEAYFNDLQSRVMFLEKLRAMGRNDEALLLCCCYIEALGSRQSPKPERKAKNYCSILVQHGGNEIWQLIHPKQIKDVLSTNGIFSNTFGELAPLIDGVGGQLISPQDLSALLSPSLNEQQQFWLQENMFKGSMASISYERIRSELVHDISSAGNISFSETQYKGSHVGDINFELLYTSLRKIVDTLENKATSTGKWWWE